MLLLDDVGHCARGGRRSQGLLSGCTPISRRIIADLVTRILLGSQLVGQAGAAMSRRVDVVGRCLDLDAVRERFEALKPANNADSVSRLPDEPVGRRPPGLLLWEADG